MFGQKLNTHKIFKRLAKALIRLRVYAQADVRLCWSHIPLCWKSHVAAQIPLQTVLTRTRPNKTSSRTDTDRTLEMLLFFKVKNSPTTKIIIYKIIQHARLSKGPCRMTRILRLFQNKYPPVLFNTPKVNYN